MRNLLLFCLLFWVGGRIFAQANPDDVGSRSNLDEQYRPFYHGVASGDPLPDAVILWTRVTPDTTGPVSVDWEMALDTSFAVPVKSGTATTNDLIDYTVKIDVNGLQPATWYYYRFRWQDRWSLIGRTRTAPVGDVDSLRFGVVSCARYSSGYFNAYEALAMRNDVAAVIHLGDYIYEKSGGSGDRKHEPDKEIIDLNDYRLRHSQYKLDPHLQCLHQMYPIIPVWDDHESSNNSWTFGSPDHDTTNEGPWLARRANSIRAYFEWMPIRLPDLQDSLRIYRTLEYGELVDLIMLDTRLADRDEQVTGSAIDDSSRHMIGPVQLGWLATEMDTSHARWKVLGQQVMMAPLEIPFVGPVNPDQWDGYRAERQRVYDSILTKNITDVVVLTGDIHSNWANDLPLPGYDPSTGANSVAVEFVTTSITTENTGVNFANAIIQAANQHIKYINLADHGFFVLDLNKTRAQADYYIVSQIATQGNYTTSREESWYVLDQESHLRKATAAAEASSAMTAIAPPKKPDNPVGLEEDLATPILFGTYPNPFEVGFGIQYHLFQPGQVFFRLLDLDGRKLLEFDGGFQPEGLHLRGIDASSLARGMYLLEVESGGHAVHSRVVKVN
ncbi:MAG: alkaline phosphatase D family protein [Bacteroidia bacterium]|nr:alkaline phosphatase D family protein [Bacteroidia bacterium]